MAPGAASRRILALMAVLFEYPREGTVGAARELAALMPEALPDGAEAAALAGGFLAFIETTRAEKIEELYTSTFDLAPSCCPYVGVHLIGDNQRRRVFLVRLRERFRAHGFSAETELPDHLAVLLRFLSAVGDEDEARVIAGDGVIPAVEKMAGTLLSAGNPYGSLLQALLLSLPELTGAAPPPVLPAGGVDFPPEVRS